MCSFEFVLYFEIFLCSMGERRWSPDLRTGSPLSRDGWTCQYSGRLLCPRTAVWLRLRGIGHGIITWFVSLFVFHSNMYYPHKKHRGALAEIKAVAFLLERGYEVFRNVSAHGPADLVAYDPVDGRILLIDVKTIDNTKKNYNPELKKRVRLLTWNRETDECRLCPLEE